MGSKFLVLGTGVGKAIAHALLKTPDNLVVIADIDLKTATDAKNSLCRMSWWNHGTCIPLEFKAGKNDAIRLFRYFDVVISALPVKYNLGLAETAIKANVHFCDLGGVIEVTKQMFELNNKYPNTKTSIIPDCGLMPGLGIIIAKKLMQDLGGAESIEILVGGLPQKPQPPTYYQKVFNAEGLKHICCDPVPILFDGEIKLVKPFHDYSLTIVPELQVFSDRRIELFDTAGASLAADSFRKWGAKYFAEKTARWEGFIASFKDISGDKFEQTVEELLTIPVDAENPDLVWMKVTAWKEGVNPKSVSLLDLYDNQTGLTAMQRTTGFPTAVMAEMAVEGKTKPGVNTPENAFDDAGVSEIIDRVGRFLIFK